jgi:hypothetical protein
MRSRPGAPEDSIAFLPNYNKGKGPSSCRPLPTNPAPTLAQLSSHPTQWLPQDRRGRTELSDYAHVEPGPLSILHHGTHDILVAGRFPSILSYDRRFFPRLQSVIHSGARLSCLTMFPYAPKPARNGLATATLIAAGEYGGRGSLELYSLPHSSSAPRQQSSSSNIHEFPSATNSYPNDDDDPEHSTSSEPTFNPPSTNASPQPPPSHHEPFAYKNRQEASPAKLLSVASQGTRIVFSDAEGGLKWVERDGRGLVRRWNLNEFVYDERGGKAGVSGDVVARKICVLGDGGEGDGDGSGGKGEGERGDGELLVWTGEKLGMVSVRGGGYGDHEELVRELEGDGEGGTEKEREVEYAKRMRMALERQADERRWMSRFRLKRGLF